MPQPVRELGNLGHYPVVNHLDNDRTNDSADNLEWCTQAHNLAHARSQGRMPDNYWLGKRSPSAKLTDATAAQIRQAYSSGGVSYVELARTFGSNKRTIGRIVKGEVYV